MQMHHPDDFPNRIFTCRVHVLVVCGVGKNTSAEKVMSPARKDWRINLGGIVCTTVDVATSVLISIRFMQSHNSKKLPFNLRYLKTVNVSRELRGKLQLLQKCGLCGLISSDPGYAMKQSEYRIT
jgi:hypothetical protein